MYIDRSAEASREIRQRLAPVALEMAEAGVEEIRAVMRQSSPAGRRYPNPAGPGFVTAARAGQPPAIHTHEYERAFGSLGPLEAGSRALAAVTNPLEVGRRVRRHLWHILEFGWKNGGPFPHIRPAMGRLARLVRAQGAVR